MEGSTELNQKDSKISPEAEGENETAVPQSFKFADLEVEKTKNPLPKVPEEELTFGKYNTDHMFEVEWNEENGWGKPKIVPYHKLVLDPKCTVFHYALECFEGFKAYLDANNRIRLFRPMDNMKRLRRSMRRSCLPDFEEGELLECLKVLLKLEKEWIPKGNGYSLYVRPTGISIEDAIGVMPPKKALLYIILCPVCPYYKTMKPIKLLADAEHVRAWPGGTGDYKLGSNYAPTLLPQREAMKRGYSQVMWLSGPDYEVTEVGMMNVFFVFEDEGKKEVVTPPLNGLILPGVTRNAIVELVKDEFKDYVMNERTVTMKELLRRVEDGTVREAFGCGTAAIVAPIEGFEFMGKYYSLPLEGASAGKLTHEILTMIQDIQRGNIQHPWSIVVD